MPRKLCVVWHSANDREKDKVTRVVMTQIRTILPLLRGCLLGVVVATTAQADAPADNVFLQCEREIRNARRARIIDHPSGEVLFSPGQCKLSDMKIACEQDDDSGIRQLFISRTSGDAIFEGYSESEDQRSNLVLEHYICVKQAREALF